MVLRMAAVDPNRKTRMCDWLRAASSAFVAETAAASKGPVEDTSLRAEVDCLLALWQAGAIDPVREFRDLQNLAETRGESTGSSPVPLH